MLKNTRFRVPPLQHHAIVPSKQAEGKRLTKSPRPPFWPCGAVPCGAEGGRGRRGERHAERDVWTGAVRPFECERSKGWRTSLDAPRRRPPATRPSSPHLRPLGHVALEALLRLLQRLDQRPTRQEQEGAGEHMGEAGFSEGGRTLALRALAHRSSHRGSRRRRGPRRASMAALLPPTLRMWPYR